MAHLLAINQSLRRTQNISFSGISRYFWGFNTSKQRLTEKRHIQLSSQRLFDVVLDVDSYKEFLPFCVQSKVIQSFPPNSFEADLAIGFQNMNGKYRSQVTYDAKEQRWIKAKSIDSAIFSQMNSEWRFYPRDDVSIDVEFDIEFELSDNAYLLRPVLNTVLEDVAVKQVSAFVERGHHLNHLKQLNESVTERSILESDDKIKKDRYKVAQRISKSPITGRILQR